MFEGDVTVTVILLNVVSQCQYQGVTCRVTYSSAAVTLSTVISRDIATLTQKIVTVGRLPFEVINVH